MKPLTVYVHIPFCTVKCGYCDFNAYAGMDALKEAYAAALLGEIEAYSGLLAGHRVTSIAFGGGTPSEIAPAAIVRTIAAIRGCGAFDAGAEVSLEANPGTIPGGALAALRAGGVTRLSLGAQSFDGEELAFLDRVHSAAATAAAVRGARRAGFESVGLDLIYGLPGHTGERWRSTLERAFALEPDHLSLYALTVEEGTALARRVDRREVALPGDDAVADLYELATDVLAAAGFAQYELSNWARPGHESRHNQVYWTDGDYLGIGAGAHGYVDGRRYENVAHPRAYVEHMRSHPGVQPVADAYEPGCATAMSDWFALRLRRLAGFAPVEFASRFGITLLEAAGEPLAEVRAAGLVEVGDPVRLSRRGRLLHGEVAARFLAHLRRRFDDERSPSAQLHG